MDKKDLIFSTVALSAVMLTSSLGYTPTPLRAAEVGVETTDEEYNEDEGEYYGEDVYFDENGNISVGENFTKEKKFVINSYNEKVTIFKGDSLSINDLKIHCSNKNASARFSNGKVRTRVYENTGTFSDTVTVTYKDNVVTLPVTIYVKEEEAPTINGVHDIKCFWSGVPKSMGLVKYAPEVAKEEIGRDYSKWVADPNDEALYPIEQLLLKDVYAEDCHGNKISKDNIKVTGWDVYNYNKNQKVTYTVTDSDGKTTTKTCNLYIDNGNRYYKKAKTMTVVYGGYLSQYSFVINDRVSLVDAKYVKVKSGKYKGKYRYEAVDKPIKVKVGDKFKVIGYVVNPSTGEKRIFKLGFGIDKGASEYFSSLIKDKRYKREGEDLIYIIEYKGKEYYYVHLRENPNMKAFEYKAPKGDNFDTGEIDKDCCGLKGGNIRGSDVYLGGGLACYIYKALENYYFNNYGTVDYIKKTKGMKNPDKPCYESPYIWIGDKCIKSSYDSSHVY